MGSKAPAVENRLRSWEASGSSPRWKDRLPGWEARGLEALGCCGPWDPVVEPEADGDEPIEQVLGEEVACCLVVQVEGDRGYGKVT